MDGIVNAPWNDALVERARQGDAAAFDAIYREFQPAITGYLRYMTGDPEAAADLTQEVFLKAYRALKSTQPGLNVRSWLYAIATNEGRSYHRRARLIRWLPFSPSNEPTTPGPDSAEPPDAVLAAALAAMPRDDAACVLLSARDGFSYEEIGRMLRISPAAAKTRAYRGRIALAKALQPQEAAR